MVEGENWQDNKIIICCFDAVLLNKHVSALGENPPQEILCFQ